MLSPYYLNLEGFYGAETDFSTLEELLSYLDRLGIYQTTVTCKEFNIAPSNRKLMQDLERVAGAKERVIPVFQATPFPYVVQGQMEELADMVSRFPAAGLSLEPKTKGFRLITAEGVLRRLREFRPVIFLRWAEFASCPDDLVYLAERFPDLNFVVQRAMWGDLTAVFYLMERCSNIYYDNSLLHTLHGAKVVTDQFGPSRLLFSLGARSNYGAAFGGLAFDYIPQEMKDKIAWDNAAQLFPAAGYAWLLENRRHLEDKIENRFWKLFKAGKPMDVPTVDAHTHISRLNYKWMNPYYELNDVVDDMLKVMDQLGIDISVSSDTERPLACPLQPSEDMMEATRGHHDRFKGYLHYRPTVPGAYTDEYLDKIFDNDYFIGIKTLPQYEKLPIDGEEYKPMFEYAEKHGLPILLHTWNSKDGCGTALRCGNAAKPFPHAKVILGHSGGGDAGRLECHKMAESGEYENVFYEYCGSFTSSICWSETLKHIDYHKVLFGTDTHDHDAAWELARLLTDELTDEQLTAILGGNAIRILGLKPVK